MKTQILAFAVLAGVASVANAANIITDWTEFTSTSSLGTFGEIQITASTSETAPFLGFYQNHFSHEGGWDAAYPLSPLQEALVVSNVNAGDWQLLEFSSPMEGMLYIENLDSSSIARVTASGASSVMMVTGSESISFVPTDENEGVLVSLNTSFDGEGDVVLSFHGAVESIRLDFVRGEQANGVTYTVTQAIPEPASATLLGMAGVGLLGFRRRRQAASNRTPAVG